MPATPKQFMPLIATVFILLFLWLSTVPIISWYELSGQHQELQDAEFQWFHKGHSNYNFEIEIMARSSPPDTAPIRIYVRDSELAFAYRVDDEEPVDISDMQHVPQTIDDSFQFVSRLLEERPRYLTVEYDAAFSYPKRIVVGRTENPVDEIIYSIRWFEPEFDDAP